MTTLRMRFSISETCLTEVNAMHAWPHSQRWHAINDNAENVVINFWDLSDRNYAKNKPPHSQSWHALYGNPENEVFFCSGLCVLSYFYTRATSFSEMICNKRQHWEWGYQFVRYISPKLMLCIHWLILRREMQYMPTMKVRSSISETCLTRIKSANVWPHSQRWHARNDNTEKEVLIFSDFSGQNYFYTWATSFSEVTCNKRQQWKWGFQFVRYIYMTKANAMHALTHSQTWNAIYAHTVSEAFNLWNLSDQN